MILRDWSLRDLLRMRTENVARGEDVDAQHKAGHDGYQIVSVPAFAPA